MVTPRKRIESKKSQDQTLKSSHLKSWESTLNQQFLWVIWKLVPMINEMEGREGGLANHARLELLFLFLR